MKNKLLILAFSLPFFLMAQKATKSNLNVTVVDGPKLISAHSTATDKINQDNSVVNSQPRSTTTNGLKRSLLPYSFIKIGNTNYDLQTNASMGRRIIVLPNGNVSAVWTTSVDKSTNFTNRGTGYNSFNGTSWFTPPAGPTPRLEAADRTGWPSIGVNGSSEWVMGHSASDGGYFKSNNASIGSNVWTTGSKILSQPQRRPIWGRVMNNGDIFHCLSNYADSGAAGEPRAPKINGIFAPFTYSRSTDGGTTWSTQHILLPEYDSVRYVNGGGDNYALDVRDSIVVVVAGGAFEDVAIWKSTNNGVTFTKTVVDSFKYAPYNSKKLMLDTTITSDGSVDVLIDASGNAHVFWGILSVTDDDTNDLFYTSFPATTGIAYWNEITKSRSFIASGLQFDLNSNGKYDIMEGTWRSLTSTGTIPSPLLSVARLGSTGLLHMPSAGMDANGNIFVSFSAPIEGNLDLNECNYRDIIMIHSTDSGATWSEPADISKNLSMYDKGQPIFNEEEFACVARKVNNFVHIVFQSDELPGTNLQNNSRNDNNHPISEKGNDIMYAAVPVSKLLDGSINNSPLSIEDVHASREVFIVSQNFPNPFSNNSEVIIWLENESNVTMEITNVQGRVVSTQNFDLLSGGNHKLEINGEGLSSGVYFYTIKTSSNSATQKMMIQH